MKLYTDIVTDYLAGRSLAAHAQEWFFTQPGYCFQEPDGSDAQKAAVMQVYEQVLRTVETFPATVRSGTRCFRTGRTFCAVRRQR